MDSDKRAMNSIDDAFDQAPCGLVTAAVDGTIVRVNATFCRWVGCAAHELLEQRRVQDLLTVGGRVFHQTHLAPLLQIQGSVAEVKLEIRHADGHKLPVLINAVRRKHDATEYDDFAFVIVTDRNKYEQELLVTRQRAEAALEAKEQAEDALRLADRRKDEFLATLAHELRNPLGPIRAVVELIRLKQFDDPQVVWARGVLERQVGHVSRLVDDLLEISRVAEGKLELRIEHVDLSMAIQQAIESSRALIDASSHRLIANLPDVPLFLDVDPTRLSQIVQNVINNAAKYTPAGGTIHIDATREDEEVVISVRDTGIGIAPEHLPTIFGIFAQLAPGLSRSQGGLGIGLSLVRALVERHGGTVKAFSAGVGKGSEFVIRLPLSPNQGNLQSKTSEKTPGSSRKSMRILIIDDNEDAAESLAMLLEIEGHEIQTAGDGMTGLRLFQDNPADAVVLDIGLPDITGYDIARRIRKATHGASALLIAVTGWGQEKDQQEAIEAGFDFHFIKPVDYRRLLTVLNQ